MADTLSRISPCPGESIRWPSTPLRILGLSDFRDELTGADGVIINGTRILIPKTRQADVLQQLHYAHQEAKKRKLRANGSTIWVNINRDIEEMVKSCAPCQSNQRMNLKEPLKPHNIPQKPWNPQLQTLHSADHQGPSNPLTDWTYELNRKCNY